MAFLRTLSEGDGDARPPLPFTVPDTDAEDEDSELGKPIDKRSETIRLSHPRVNKSINTTSRRQKYPK